MQKLYDAPADNRAYMDGWLKATQASGLDWAKARIEIERIADEVRALISKKDTEILTLKGQLRKQKEEYEAKLLDMESQLEAWKIAWKHRSES